ncbi:adenylate kinase 7 [Leuresthes tenuis]|uniref:adenylate kinase 7 n=1 Tax=Leuresthes tenuis TaxID=355514 RepID=UPI003B510ABD
MAEKLMEKVEQSPRRVFLNNIDSYSSGNIAKFLCESVTGAPAEEEEEEEEEEEDEEEEEQGSHLSGGAAFQVVGTVSDRSNEGRPHVLEEYLHPGRDELLSHLMDCDVVIYDVTQHADQVEEATWAVTALHEEMSRFCGPKLFVLVSTVMTWACSKAIDPDDPELPLTDQIFWSRKAHPNFKRHLELEKRVVKLGKTNRALLSTYVVASGLQYGMGEQLFHHFFKESWLGRAAEISVFGHGHNIVPTIHIRDLSSVVHSVIAHQPKPFYLLAVDSSHNTMEEIIKAVAAALGPGQIQKRPFEEAFLLQDMSVMEIDSLLVNLRMEAVCIKKLFSINWLCEFGLVENMELVVEEYRQTRGLQPIRICVLGPPAVGKTTVSKQICERYKLHHITLMDVVSEAIAQLEDVVKNSDVEDSVTEAQELLSSLKDSGESDRGVSEEQLQVLKDKLMSYPCRNQGFVLDDFPNIYEQAKEVFDGEEQDEATPHSRRRMPDFVLCLDASDDFLMDRVIELPERLVQEHDYEPELFLRRLEAYRESVTWDETVVSYFIEQDIAPLHLEVTSSEEPGSSLLMQKVFDSLGPPRNYSPSRQEVEEEERSKAEERTRTEARERVEEEKQEQEEARSRAERWAEWTQSLEEAKRQEEQQLEDLSAPMRSYLLEHIMPTLVQGLSECCRTQPPDPVDFLAEFLLKNNTFDFPQKGCREFL